MLALARYKVSGKAVPCSCVMDYAKGQEPVCTLPLIAGIPTEEESSSFAIVFAVELVALGTTDRKMAAISSSSPYDGNRDNFAKFQAALETSMAFSRLSYLWNSAELARLVLAPPAIVFVEGGPANQRRYLNTMAMTAHNLATAECVKHARNIHVDFLQAIGILQGLCNDKILRDIEEFVNPALDRPSRAKFMAAWNYLVSTYGPVDQMDVDKIKAQLRSADPNFLLVFVLLKNIVNGCLVNVYVLIQHQLSLLVLSMANPHSLLSHVCLLVEFTTYQPTTKHQTLLSKHWRLLFAFMNGMVLEWKW